MEPPHPFRCLACGEASASATRCSSCGGRTFALAAHGLLDVPPEAAEPAAEESAGPALGEVLRFQPDRSGRSRPRGRSRRRSG